MTRRHLPVGHYLLTLKSESHAKDSGIRIMFHFYLQTVTVQSALRLSVIEKGPS